MSGCNAVKWRHMAAVCADWWLNCHSLGGRRIVNTTQIIRKKVYILICINYMFRPTVAIIRFITDLTVTPLRSLFNPLEWLGKKICAMNLPTTELTWAKAQVNIPWSVWSFLLLLHHWPQWGTSWTTTGTGSTLKSFLLQSKTWHGYKEDHCSRGNTHIRGGILQMHQIGGHLNAPYTHIEA